VTGPSSGDRPAEETCEGGCGCRYGTSDPDRTDCACDGPCCNADDAVWFATPPAGRTRPLPVDCTGVHDGDGCDCPPAVHTGDDAATVAREAALAVLERLTESAVFAYRYPGERDVRKECAAAADALLSGLAPLSASPPVSGTATRDDVVSWIFQHQDVHRPLLVADRIRHVLDKYDELAALGAGQPAAQPDCPRCSGTGAEPDDEPDERTYPCQRCGGSGEVAAQRPEEERPVDVLTQPADEDGLRARVTELAKTFQRMSEDENTPLGPAADAWHDAALDLRRALDGDGGDRG